jgi:hypothetical protein
MGRRDLVAASGLDTLASRDRLDEDEPARGGGTGEADTAGERVADVALGGCGHEAMCWIAGRVMCARRCRVRLP